MSTPQIKTDCFGYHRGDCRVLNEMLCKTTGKCPFYTTKEQFLKDKEKYSVVLEDKRQF